MLTRASDPEHCVSSGGSIAFRLTVITKNGRILSCSVIQTQTILCSRTLLRSSRASSDTVSFTFTYHTWQFIIIFFIIFTITTCIFSYSFSLSLWTKDLALQQIISSIDLFLSYRTDSTDSLFDLSAKLRRWVGEISSKFYQFGLQWNLWYTFDGSSHSRLAELEHTVVEKKERKI